MTSTKPKNNVAGKKRRRKPVKRRKKKKAKPKKKPKPKKKTKKKTKRRKKGPKKTAAKSVNVKVLIGDKKTKSEGQMQVGQGKGSLDILKTSSEALGRVRDEFAKARKEDAERYAKLKQEVERERSYRKWTDSKSGFRMSAPRSYPVPQPSINPIGTMIPSTLLTEIERRSANVLGKKRNTSDVVAVADFNNNHLRYDGINNHHYRALYNRIEDQFSNIHRRFDKQSISQHPRVSEVNDTISEATSDYVPSSITESNYEDAVEESNNGVEDIDDDVNDFESAHGNIEPVPFDIENNVVDDDTNTNTTVVGEQSESGNVSFDTVIDEFASDDLSDGVKPNVDLSDTAISQEEEIIGVLQPVTPEEAAASAKRDYEVSDMNVFKRLTGFDSLEAAKGHKITKSMMSKVLKSKLFNYSPQGSVLDGLAPLQQGRLLTAALITGEKTYKYKNKTYPTPQISIGAGVLSTIFPEGTTPKTPVKPTPMKTRSKGKKKRVEPVRTIEDVGSSGVNMNEALEGIMATSTNEPKEKEVNTPQKRTKKDKPTSKPRPKRKVRRRKPK